MPEDTAADDPFLALAQVKARRAMADLAGFPHHPSWDRLETEARERLRGDRGDAPAAAPEPAVTEPPAEVADPLLALAQVTAFRMAADTMGVAHDPAWDGTEQQVTSQLHRQANDHPHPPPD
jgi:hypothetical protein